MLKKVTLIFWMALFSFQVNAKIPDGPLGKIESLQDAEWDLLNEFNQLGEFEDEEDGLAVLEEDIDEEENVYINAASSS